MSSKKKRTLPSWMKSPTSTVFSARDEGSTPGSSCSSSNKMSASYCDLSKTSDTSLEECRSDAIDPLFASVRSDESTSSCISTTANHADRSMKVVQNDVDSEETSASSNDLNSGSIASVNAAVDISQEVASSNDIASSSRRSCYYGSSCYRKNPQHHIEYAHPGDDDYQISSNPPNDSRVGGSTSDDRPLCQYGSACYRKNTQHRLDFRHDTPTKRQARPAQFQDIPSDNDDGDFNGSISSDDYNPGESESDDSFVSQDSFSSGNSDYDPEEEEKDEDSKKRKKKQKEKGKVKKKLKPKIS